MRPARWPLPTSEKFTKFGPVVAGLLIALVVLVIEAFRESPVNRSLSDFLQAAVVFGAAYCSWRVARHSRGYSRQLWMLLTASLLISGAAKALEGTEITEATASAAGEAAAEGAKPLTGNAYKVQLLKVAVKRAALLAAGAKPYWEG